MSMRVTQGMLSRNVLTDLNHNLQRLAKYNEQMSSKRKINRPSDDPVGFHYAMRSRSELRANEQYQTNRDHAKSWLEVTESMMNSVNDILQRAREKAVDAANGGTNPDTALESIKSEIDELYEQLISIGNEQFNGKYVFNGEKTQAQPYDPSNPQASEVHKGKIILHIAPGVQLEVNVTGDEVFGEAGSNDNLFLIMQDFSEALSNEDTEAINGVIERIDERNDAFLKTLASVGARTRRIELTTERLDDDNLNLTKVLSQVEDIDFEETTTNLKMAESAYLSSLSVAARIIQPSLVDFLK